MTNREKDFNPYHKCYSLRYSSYDHYWSIYTNLKFQTALCWILYITAKKNMSGLVTVIVQLSCFEIDIGAYCM